MNIDPRGTLQGCNVFDTLAWNGKNVQLCQGWRSFMYEFFVPIFFFHTIKRTKTFIKNSIEFVREIFFFLPLFKTLLNASSHPLEYTWVAYGLEGIHRVSIFYSVVHVHVRACTQARLSLGWVDFSLLGKQTVWQLRYPFAPGYLHWRPSKRVATPPFR